MTVTKSKKKELAKTRFLKFSKTSRILTAFSRHNTESQMVAIVTDKCGTWEYKYIFFNYPDVYVNTISLDSVLSIVILETEGNFQCLRVTWYIG
jgi:hypothetical protein